MYARNAALSFFNERCFGEGVGVGYDLLRVVRLFLEFFDGFYEVIDGL